MPKAIHDEFSHIESPQRRYQLRMRKAGRCPICGEVAVKTGFCEKHAQKNREHARDIYRDRVIAHVYLKDLLDKCYKAVETGKPVSLSVLRKYRQFVEDTGVIARMKKPV